MTVTALRFAGLFFTALLVGTMFGIWLGFNPANLSASAYVEMQQNSIRSLNVTLPLLGLLCIALNGALAVATRHNVRTRWLLIAAVLCLLTAGLITRFANQPINAVVIAWHPNVPPSNWVELRDLWWRWHIVRTVTAVAGFCLALLAAVGPASSGRTSHAA